MDAFGDKLKRIQLMYMQEQLHVAFAELLRHKAEYKYMHAATQLLFEDVLKNWEQYSKLYKPKQFSKIKEDLVDGMLGYIDQDADIACKIINKIDEKQAYYGNMIDLYALLTDNRAVYKIIPDQGEYRITEEESNDVMFNYGLTKLDLRFVNVITPRDKYYKLFGDVESINKARLAIGKPELTFDTIGEEEKAIIRKNDSYIRIYELLTYKHPEKVKPDLLKNIDVAVNYLQHETEQDVLDNTEFEVVGVEDSTNDGQNENDDTVDTQQPDKAEDVITQATVDEPSINDELKNEDANAYLPIQEHMEEIYIFSRILKDEKEKLGTYDDVVEAILDISNEALSVFDKELAVPFDEIEGIQFYKQDQLEDINYYLNDLVYRTDLQTNIIDFFDEICDPMLTFELEEKTKYLA